MNLLVQIVEAPIYALGFYLFGLVVTLPGMVIGRHMEDRTIPKWHSHVAILVVGVFAFAFLVYGRSWSL